MQFLIQSYAFDKEFHTFLQGLVVTAVRSVDQQQPQPVVAAVAPAAAAVVDATTAALDDTSDLPWQQLTHVNVATVTGDSGMSGNSSHHNHHADIETSSDTATTATAVTTAGNKRKVLSPDASSNVSEVRKPYTLCNALTYNCHYLSEIMHFASHAYKLA
jgi:hypothetical protein